MYKNICISLFEKDKLLFSFTLCCKLIEFDGNLDMVEYRFFLTGGISLGEEPEGKPAAWITDKTWAEFNRMAKLKGFKGFLNEFTEKLDEWEEIYDDQNP